MSDEAANTVQTAITPPSDAGNAPNSAENAAQAGVKTESQPFSWPEQWRTQLAAGDAKEATRLERFKAPEDIYKSYRQLESKLSKGELRSTTPFPDKGTPEDQAAWRKEQGLPESYDKYDTNVGEGIVWGEQDKSIIDSFLKEAHSANMRPTDVKAALAWYHKNQVAVAEQQTVLDKAKAQEVTDQLRAQWGADYRANMNYITGLLDSHGNDVKDAILNSRTPDGTPLASSPAVLEFLVKVAREINPIPTMVGGNATPDSIQSEIDTLKAKMMDRNSDYWKGPTAERQQARYRDLVSAQSKMGKR